MRPQRRPVPPALTSAASLVAVQGVVLAAAAVLGLLEFGPAEVAGSTPISLFVLGYALLLVAAAWSLRRLRAWARGPVLFTQLIAVGVAWNLRDVTIVALVLGLSAVLVAAGLLHPASVEALQEHDVAPE